MDQVEKELLCKPVTGMSQACVTIIVPNVVNPEFINNYRGRNGSPPFHYRPRAAAVFAGPLANPWMDTGTVRLFKVTVERLGMSYDPLPYNRH